MTDTLISITDINEQRGLIQSRLKRRRTLSRAQISISGGGLGVSDATPYLQTKEDANYKITGVPRTVACTSSLYLVNVVQRPRVVYFWKSTYVCVHMCTHTRTRYACISEHKSV